MDALTLRHPILFVVHAGEGVGLGHLRRSLVAANALISRLDAIVDFVAVGSNIDASLADEFTGSFSSTDGAVCEELSNLTNQKKYSAVCLDLFRPLLSEDLFLALQAIRNGGTQIVSIDPLIGFEKFVDLLYVPSFISPPADQISQFQGRLVHGWDAYLLNVSVSKNIATSKGSVLALTGGGDTTGLGQGWPKTLGMYLPANTVVHWVTGPFSNQPIFPRCQDVEFIEYTALNGLNEIMQKVDIAVTVFGVSFFELIALGVPTVVFSPYGEKDSRELDMINSKNIALIASDAEDAAKKAALLLGDLNLKKELSSNASKIIKKFSGECFSRELKKLLCN